MVFGRILLAFALLGPPLIGIIAAVISFLVLRRHRRDLARGPSSVAVIVASVIWISLCVGTALVLQYLAFNFAWTWAHVKRPPLTSEEFTLLAIVAIGLIGLGACAFALHRLFSHRGPVVRR
jgi:sterol desaturase/sphingolipid hydroxylase (fatty acid hydroxylase superfamily)